MPGERHHGDAVVVSHAPFKPPTLLGLPRNGQGLLVAVSIVLISCLVVVALVQWLGHT